MDTILSTSLIALCCAVLSGCGSVPGQGPEVPAAADATQTQSSTAASQDQKAAGVEDWKSCERRLHPGGNYTVSAIQAMFGPPQDVPQLLHNLKIAADRGLLLQPAFYDEATLLRFFKGSKVTLTDSNFYVDKLSSGIEAGIESDTSPKLSFTIASVCRVDKHSEIDGSIVYSESSDSYLRGSTRDSVVKLSDIRAALGPEDRVHIGWEDPDLAVSQPTNKGNVKYENVGRPGVPDSRIQTRFFFERNGVSSIGDSDVMRRVEMHDMQDHVDLPLFANSTPTQNTNVNHQDTKEGGIVQWRACAELLHLEDRYTVSEIQAMFESPQNIPQLLQNLKIAAERGLLLQPSFYDEARLSKFFHGSKVRIAKPPAYQSKGNSAIEADITSDTFPKAVIEVSSNCMKYDTNVGGTATRNVDANGFVTITMVPGQFITLRDIRSVFGPTEPFEELRGRGAPYPSTGKGSVTYEIRRGVGFSDFTQTRFYFRSDGVEAIGDSDVVQSIVVRNSQNHILENR